MIGVVAETLSSPDVLQDIYVELSSVDDRAAAHAAIIAGAEAGIADLTAQIQRTVQAIARLPESDALLANLKDLEAARRMKTAELAALQSAAPASPPKFEDLDQMRLDLAARLGSGDGRTQQLALRALDTRVVITPTGRGNASGYVELDLGATVRISLP